MIESFPVRNQPKLVEREKTSPRCNLGHTSKCAGEYVLCKMQIVNVAMLLYQKEPSKI